jgi:hypothetical protein
VPILVAAEHAVSFVGRPSGSPRTIVIGEPPLMVSPTSRKFLSYVRWTLPVKRPDAPTSLGSIPSKPNVTVCPFGPMMLDVFPLAGW